MANFEICPCNVFVLALVLIIALKVKEFQRELLIFITEVSLKITNIIKHSLHKDPVCDKAVEEDIK